MGTELEENRPLIPGGTARNAVVKMATGRALGRPTRSKFRSNPELATNVNSQTLNTTCFCDFSRKK